MPASEASLRLRELQMLVIVWIVGLARSVAVLGTSNFSRQCNFFVSWLDKLKGSLGKVDNRSEVESSEESDEDDGDSFDSEVVRD